LTDREQSIVGFIAVGHSNKEIAREMGVAPETIKTHLKRIFHKLSAETRAQAVVRAQSLGMLTNASRPLGAPPIEASKRASPSAVF
jgi:LuxR family maltose regulon positive regulatory protein